MAGGRDDDEQQPDTVAIRRRSPSPAGPAPPPDADADFAEALPPGTIAGRYVLLARLGAGGAGLVYAAYDPELDRKVALKLLRASEDEEHQASHGRARLLREGQAMARLKHPNIVPVYDVGTLEHAQGSRVFMAMELIEGGTLRQWLKEPHSRREILDVMIACGRGLEAAHAAGMVHRDFKPDNVLVGRDGRVVVTDFGLVRAAGPSEKRAPDARPPAALASPLTAADTVLGTPGYMAPEQYQAETIDARTDQFSFCVTLCEALCGKRVFTGHSMAELEAATFGGRAVEAMRAARLPGWLVRPLARGLSVERAARHPSMGELLRALSADPSRRVRRIVAAAVALVVVAGGALALERVAAKRSELCSGAERQLDGVWDAAARERVRQAFNRANVAPLYDSVAAALDRYARELTAEHRDACEATRVRGDQPESVMALRMSCLDVRKKELGALASLLADADRATAFGAVESAAKLSSVRSCGDIAALTARVPPPADASARRRVGELTKKLAQAKVLTDAARYPAARPLVEEVLRGEAPLGYGPLRAEALVERARLEREQDGDMKAGERSLVDAVTAAYQSHDDARVASAMTDLGYLDAYWLGEHEEGLRWVGFARAAIERLGGSDELEAERARVEAEIFIGQDKGKEAVAAAVPALRLAEKVYGPVSVQAAKFHSTLGAAESTAGDNGRAREHYTAQHDILVRLVGPEHPLVAMADNNLGLVAEADGRLDAAERYYRESATLLERSLGPDHPRVAVALSNLGVALRERNKPDEALAAFQRVLAINEKRFGPNYPDSLDALLGEGESLVALGRPKEARAPIERALAMTSSGEPNPWGLAEARFALAEALWASGGDRARAHALAVAAKKGLASETNALARGLAGEIDAWLQQH